MQPKTSNTKTYIIVAVVILLVLFCILGMLWYYNQYVTQLNNSSQPNATTNSNSLPLPILSNIGGEEESASSGNTVLNTKGVLDNLNNVENYDQNTEILQGAKVLTIEDLPIANYTILTKQTSTSSPKQIVARYITRANGELIDYDLVTGNKTRLELFKIGKVEQAIFNKNGDYVVIRNEDSGEIVSKLVHIPTNSTYEMDRNITSLDFMDNGNLVYGLKKADGYAVKLLDINTKKVKDLTVLQMTEWSVENAGGSIVRATFKPTGYAEGITSTIDTANLSLKSEVKPIIGLVSKKLVDNKYLLLSEGGIGYNKLLFMNRSNQNIFSLNANTFLEKCARELIKAGVVCAIPEKLDKQAVYPDTWYKSQTHTKDKLVYKSLTSTSTKLVYSFEGATISVDNLSVTNAGVFFQNTNTGGLYTIR